MCAEKKNLKFCNFVTENIPKWVIIKKNQSDKRRTDYVSYEYYKRKF